MPITISEKGLFVNYFSGALYSCLSIPARDLELILASSGGVYVGCGIVPGLGDFGRVGVSHHFESKDRVSNELVAIPTFVIREPMVKTISITKNEPVLNDR